MRTLVSMGRSATLDEAIEVAGHEVAFFDHVVASKSVSVAVNYSHSTEAGLTTRLVGESAKPQLARWRIVLMKLEACRDVI